MRAVSWLAVPALLALVAGSAVAGKAPAGSRATAAAKLPDWSGLWVPEGNDTAISGLPENLTEARAEGKSAPSGGFNRPLFGFAAPWNEEGKRRQALRQTETANCRAQGWGFPMMMNADAPIQFFIARGKVMIVNAYRDVTDVRMAKAHPSQDDLWPTVWGDSIGHWEGDTLVIDSIAVKNPHEYFHGAPPLSDKAHYVQRIRMDKPNHLVNDITIEDSVTLTKPWTAHLAYQPAEGFDRMVYDTYDNDRTECGTDSGIAPSKVGEAGGE
ncbi:MAG: hypothetical protein ACXWJC_09505 [Croceibacterium sp.]